MTKPDAAAPVRQTPPMTPPRAGIARMGVFLYADNPYPDGSERWVARYWGKEGTIRRKEFPTRSLAELRILTDGSKLNHRFRPDMCLATMLEWFVLQLPANLSSKSVSEYRSVIDLHLVRVLGPDRAIGTLVAADYEHVIRTMHDAELEGTGIYQKMRVVCRFSVIACVGRFSRVEPVSIMTAQLFCRPKRNHYDAIPDQHLKLIRDACNPQTRAMTSLLAAGIDLAEQRRARRGDIDLAGGTIHVRHPLLPAAHDNVAPLPEGRNVPLDRRQCDDLARWLALTIGRADDPLFIESCKGDLSLQLQAVQTHAGLAQVLPCSVRRGLYDAEHFIETALRSVAWAGRSLKQIADMFGYLDTGPVDHRIGWIIDSVAKRRQDRRALQVASSRRVRP